MQMNFEMHENVIIELNCKLDDWLKYYDYFLKFSFFYIFYAFKSLI